MRKLIITSIFFILCGIVNAQPSQFTGTIVTQNAFKIGGHNIIIGEFSGKTGYQYSYCVIVGKDKNATKDMDWQVDYDSKYLTDWMKQAFTYYELFVIKTGLDSKETRTALVNYVIKELTKPVIPDSIYIKPYKLDTLDTWRGVYFSPTFL